MYRFLSVLFVLTLAATALADEPPESLVGLRAIMAERLALMGDVAKYKWNEGLPIEDIGREKVILEATVEQATEAGVEPTTATRAIESQIAAAKRIQTALFNTWTTEQANAFADAPSLTDTLRPEIGRLTGALIAALKIAEADLAECAAVDILASTPPALADFADAWQVAVNGVVPTHLDCP